MQNRFWRVILVCILVAVSLFSNWGRPAAFAQETTPSDLYAEQIADLMGQMDARDRVGQLFLVTFYGNTAGIGAPIADLIRDYHIGGVALLASNDNITDEADPATQLAGLINELQTRSYEVSQEERLPPLDESPAGASSPYVPLFVAMDHEGDGYPTTRVLSQITQIPDNMALGATWKPENAEIVGEIVGSELAAMGVNMLLGPSLDVLETPRIDSPGTLGTRTFGGDPYWVALMGQAYIRGVHQGSEDQVAVIAKHFPGHGASDREPEQEVSTVRKSLEQLKLTDLAPFFAVTGLAPEPAASTDGLMTSHIRYQGFQGNIRESTRPISFDPQALNTILALPEFAGWRSAGGLTVSDALGVRAVKRFYDPQLQDFPHRQIALDAFLAGNDVLVMSEFALSSDYDDQLANIIDTVEWFEAMYQSDAAFQERVDAAVERILRLKLSLYGGVFDLDTVLAPVSQVADNVGGRRDQIVLLAQDAVTLISPSIDELANRLPSAPNKNERIVIFTDERFARQCSVCTSEPYIAVDAIQNTILRLYGPDGSNQVLPGNLDSFSFQELEAFLQPSEQPAGTPTVTTAPPETTEEEATEEPTPAPPRIQVALNQADWIVFAMLDVTSGQSQSDAVHTFLSERPDIASDTKVIVLAFNSPYFLDTTDVSKLTAYYGIYSKVEPFVESAVKAVFQQFTPQGSSPVSVPGTGYDIIAATSPDPSQIIQLYFSQVENEPGEATPEPGPPDLRVGDSLRLRTGVILDTNGHPVPDGTLVQFTISYLSEGLGFDVPQPEVKTVGGVAEIDILLDRPGQMQVKASSGEARASVALAVTVFEDQPSIIEEIAPTPTSTPPPATPTATYTPTPVTPTHTPTTIPSPTATAAPITVPLIPDQTGLNLAHLAATYGGLLALAFAGFWQVGWRVSDSKPRRPSRGLRLSILTAIGGLLGYNYFALALPGAGVLEALLGGWGATVLAWCLGGLVLVVGWVMWGRGKTPAR